MATATVEQQTTTETMESFRKRIDDLAHDLRLEGIRLEEDENALVKLNAQYGEECRALALSEGGLECSLAVSNVLWQESKGG